MKRGLKFLALVFVLALIASACGKGDDSGGGGGGGSTESGTATQGGTLRLAMNTDVCNSFDPQKAYCSINWEFTRIMLRTLLTTNGTEATTDGTVLQPDLATEVPTVDNGGISADGLTWTFHLKDGIKYAPPLQDVTVTSGDFVRALEREACVECAASGYAFYYSQIEGFDDYSAGKADTITGLETPDDQTLVIHLTEPTGDLGYRLAMAATAPIPPNPDAPNDVLGIAEGHTKDFGRFMVATGPYMFEGSENLDFSVPADKQTPASGYQPERSISLVRNPSWDKATDDNRPAYVDQISVQIGATVEDISLQVDNGETDVGFDASYTPEQLQRYNADPALKPRLHITEIDVTSYVAMNVLQPPFDDIHVRKATNWIIDKAGITRVVGGELTGPIGTHIIPNGLTGNINADYDPYATPNSQGDLAKAQEEMKQSKYDSNGDGMCDAPECEGILVVADQADPSPKRVQVIGDSLKKIGITLDVKYASFSAMYSKCEDPANKIAMCPTVAWAKDYPDAFTFAPPLFSKASIFPSCCNLDFLGATSAQAQKWGYGPVSDIPSAEEALNKCTPLTDDQRVQCYADLDKYLMEEVVPWVPIRFSNNVDIVSERLQNYHMDAWADVMSLDHVGVGGGS